MKARMLVLSLLALTLSAPAHAYIGQRELRLDAAGLKTMQLTCGAGDLRVEGSHAEEIRVAAEIEIKGLNDEKAEAFAQKNIDLWLRKDGSRAYLKSEVHGGSWRGGEAAVHLTVFVPARFYLDISDGSGSIEIFSVQGDVKIKDGSGEIEIRDLGGDLDIRDDSGGILIEKVQGSLTLNDGSGSIEIENIQGSAVIKDGSGSISARKIAGSITIDDGSGSIAVRQILGNVIISDGSGSIDIQDVEKDVVIESDGSGSRRISNVRGNIVERE